MHPTPKCSTCQSCPKVTPRCHDVEHQAKSKGLGPFLERPGNLTGPKSYFEMKVSRKVVSVMTSNEVHFVSLSNNFTVQFSNLLKLPSGVENRTA